jgi:hypothetical protein
MRNDDGFTTKLELVRLALAGALLAVSIAEVTGLVDTTGGQAIAGGVGAVAVVLSKVIDLI